MNKMKLRKWIKVSLLSNALVLAGVIFIGCETTSPPYTPPDGNSGDGPKELEINKLRVGDTVRIDFSNVGGQLPPHEEQIKEDGTITLYLVNSVKAAGKTTGELQNELQEKYRKYYGAMTVTVKAPDRFYSVGGQVRTPKRDVYIGSTTVLKAIQSAGDFTEFADEKNVRLTRANGETVTVNCKKARQDPSLDLPVYPGDLIHVPRRFW